MAIRRPKDELVLTNDEREALRRLVRRGKAARRAALRARVVLACAEGGSDQSVARASRINPATAGKWRQRFVTRRLDGLLDEPQCGPRGR